ncbi:M20/M25/M40 family metallo-hydrolase [Blastomonas aquatica]|uniref:Peptidase M28 n=1 Tax=Blastomonas aquatica TaxID=1510276 RepID=A0ABQ1IST0_9SPHN|nr:M20/M25/M40 family metallo-hydrolase [Blastomonas aquatica]GGB51062.1 peptidase M28 [Blastomonas aquatica]
MQKFATLVAAFALFSIPAHAEVETDAGRLRADVEKLVSFGTRHTLSSPDHPTRGIGAARRWAASEFARIGKACGGCVTVEQIDRRFTGPRAPNGVNVVNVLGVQQGTGNPDDIIIISAHIDSRVSNVADFTTDAPGANDDASGVALVLEAARVLSKQKYAPTIIYAVLSGEEQGLWGGRMIAETARARGWQVRALLNNDIVGNTEGQDGRKVTDRVRVFSEGIRASESMTEAMARRGSGGEDDGPSRALMRAAQRVGKAQSDIGLEVFGVRRPDRFSRGGDHLPALELGYPAIRFTVGVENYDHQHQDIRTEGDRKFGDTIDEMDFSYLARVTALNVAVIRELATAPAAPASAMLGGALTSDTQVTWAEVPGAARYKVYWRRADARDWEKSQETTDTKLTLPGVIVDDHFAGVAAISENGAESVITFAGLPPR